MACAGFTHGPPVRLQPGEAKRSISRPSRSASAAAWRTASSHSGVPKTIFRSTVCPPPAFTSASWNPAMPTRFIHSRSLVIPSLVTLLCVQCHQVRGRALAGGSRKPISSESLARCAEATRNGVATSASVVSERQCGAHGVGRRVAGVTVATAQRPYRSAGAGCARAGACGGVYRAGVVTRRRGGRGEQLSGSSCSHRRSTPRYPQSQAKSLEVRIRPASRRAFLGPPRSPRLRVTCSCS